MLFKWFDAREAREVGMALADHFAPPDASGAAPREAPSARSVRAQDLQKFLLRVDREARPLRLNLYRRARLIHTFKWRLLERGVQPETVDELGGILLLRLTMNGTGTAPQNPGAGSLGKRRNADSLLAEGDRFLGEGAYREAIDCYQRLLAAEPRHAIAHDHLGTVLGKLGRYQEAEEEFRRAIAIKPGLAEIHANLGAVLALRGRTAEAEAPLRRAVKLNPKHVGAHLSLGMTHLYLGRLAEGKSCFEKANKLAPRHAGVFVGMGRVAGYEGHFTEAETLYRQALAVDPEHPSAWAGLVALRKMSATDVTWLESAEKVAASGIAPLAESELRFAIGKYFDDVGEFKRAFRSYARANELQKASANRYQREAHKHFVDDMIRVYTPAAFARGEAGGSDSERPVFVVGMMRSGTTLVEQIISSHPAAYGAGELGFWSYAVQKHHAALREQLLDKATRQKLAVAYLSSLSEYPANARRIVDKNTQNADYLGVIHSVLPRARMIYVQRDPADACLSCFFQRFSAAQSHTMDLSDLAHYYREHQRLMAHWRSVLPAGTLLDVPYEGLIADQEGWTRRILDFLGLEWDEHCLDFQATQRPVLTASYWQVRQKIYKDSVGRWRHYEKFIDPLLPLKNLSP